MSRPLADLCPAPWLTYDPLHQEVLLEEVLVELLLALGIVHIFRSSRGHPGREVLLNTKQTLLNICTEYPPGLSLFFALEEVA